MQKEAKICQHGSTYDLCLYTSAVVQVTYVTRDLLKKATAPLTTVYCIDHTLNKHDAVLRHAAYELHRQNVQV